MLLSLRIPYVLYASVYIQMLIHSNPIDTGLNQHRLGLPPLNSEFQIRPRILLSIQYSPLSHNCLTRSLIMSSFFIILLKPHMTSIKEMVLSRLDSNHSPSTIAYTNKYSILSLSSFHRVKQSGLVRVFLVQLIFHQTPILKCTIMT
jgi:hypothetical protein